MKNFKMVGSSNLFSNPKLSWVWLLLRLYVGWEWLSAGWAKLGTPVWTGGESGVALSGFVNGAFSKMSGAHPDVSVWYGYFLEHFVLPHAGLWSHFVVYGEILVGIALILGVFTGVAAFFGVFMNFNYLFAGTISTNPILLLFGLLLILAGRTAGALGFDSLLLPWFVKKMDKRVFKKEKEEEK